MNTVDFQEVLAAAQEVRRAADKLRPLFEVFVTERGITTDRKPGDMSIGQVLVLVNLYDHVRRQ